MLQDFFGRTASTFLIIINFPVCSLLLYNALLNFFLGLQEKSYKKEANQRAVGSLICTYRKAL